MLITSIKSIYHPAVHLYINKATMEKYQIYHFKETREASYRIGIHCKQMNTANMWKNIAFKIIHTTHA